MADTEYQRPEGKLLADAMRRDGRSARKIAPDAGITDSRLRHIVNGYQPAGRGQKIAVRAPAATLARIAKALAVTPDQLEQAGRNDAAAVLREMAWETAEYVGDFQTWVETTDILSDFQRREVLRAMEVAAATGEKVRVLPDPDRLPDDEPLKALYKAAVENNDPVIDEWRRKYQDAGVLLEPEVDPSDAEAVAEALARTAPEHAANNSGDTDPETPADIRDAN